MAPAPFGGPAPSPPRRARGTLGHRCAGASRCCRWRRLRKALLTGAEQHGLAEEQAALRRVATLVARGAAPDEELFAAVTDEVGALLNADYAVMGRYELDGTLTVVGAWG